MNPLVIATRNGHKAREIREILGDVAWVRTLNDFPDVPEIDENGDTFESNAIHKASLVASQLNLAALADDSGLEVDALNGEPGVRSARFAGDESTDQENNEKLLRLMEGIPPESRTARFRCVMAFILPDGTRHTGEGVCEGTILNRARGTGGFGYDPLFVPSGYSDSFSVLKSDIKNRISHRGRALRKIGETIRRVLRDEAVDLTHQTTRDL